MSSAVWRELRWLPRPPSDFGPRCRALLASGGASPDDLRAMATFAHDEGGLRRLAKLADMARSGSDDGRLSRVRLALLSNATTDLLAPLLVGTGLRHGLLLDVVAAPFGHVAQAALDPHSDVRRSRPDAALFALDFRGVPFAATLGDEASAEVAARRAVHELFEAAEAMRAAGVVPLLQTLTPPPEPLFGGYDLRAAGSPRDMCRRFNAGLVAKIEGSGCALVDVSATAEAVGTADWIDPTLWNLAKLPCAPALAPLYAEIVCRKLAALRGKARRALVLDLDNTLWGGVVGDDGLAGLALGQGDATGEAHLAVQKLALDYRARGVALAVCSKNEDATARQPFREHPDMLLREEHIAVFQANWTDKATNIKAIAETLSLGLESFVFLDDNPAEREQVRRELPDVAVPELPDDPALYARTLAAAGYFEAATFSAEDRARADAYRDNAARAELAGRSSDLGEYLRSLTMTISFAPFDAPGRPRIAQLIAKSNQFNLTTRRYGEAEVAALEADPSVFTLQVRLADRFGDNGMISVVVCRLGDEAWDIDLWLMSCRVLGRGVERAVLQEIARHAAAAGATAITGAYVPSARNALVRDHYEKLGFARLAADADGTTRWRLDLSAVDRTPLPMAVERAPFPPSRRAA